MDTICGNNTICSDTLLVGFTPITAITLDLSAIGLSIGTHRIQIRLSDDGLTKADSELSNEVVYVVSEWETPTQIGDTLTITQVFSAQQDGDTLTIG